MGPFTWLGLTAADPRRASAVHQLRPYFVRNAIENPNPAIDPLELLIIQPFTGMPSAVGFGKFAKKSFAIDGYGLSKMWSMINPLSRIDSCNIEIGDSNRDVINFWLNLINPERFLICNHLCKYDKTTWQNANHKRGIYRTFRPEISISKHSAWLKINYDTLRVYLVYLIEIIRMKQICRYICIKVNDASIY